MRCISPSIRSQINSEKDRLMNETHYHVRKRKMIYKFLSAESNKHSAAIEFPDGTRLSGKDAVNYAAENLARSHNTFCSLYRGELNRDLIFDVWESLMPDFKPKKFRTSSDGFCRPKYSAHAYPSNVSRELELFMVENNSIKDALDKAFHAHLHLLRIHPFLDGNGRLGRVIQNGILLSDDYPPLMIHKKDRSDYMDLIEKAQTSYEYHDRRKTRKQTEFYNYLAMNLWCSLKRAREMVEEKQKTLD